MVGMLWGAPLIVLLLLGLVVFLAYGIWRGFSFRELLKLSLKGMGLAKNVAIVMLMIGSLSALWRSCGTIAFIVSASLNFVSLEFFLPAVFMLNLLMSVLTGTSFGTIATMGIISMSLGSALGADSAYTAGAVLSGAYFGDRCSPISTSAILVAEVTETKLYKNIVIMCKTGLAAFVVSLALYFVLSFYSSEGVYQKMVEHQAELTSVQNLFSAHFTMNGVLLLPALSIIVMSVFRVNVKVTMMVSIGIAGILCAVLQGMGFVEILKITFFGFECNNKTIGSMLNGGGMFSMIKLSAVVCIALCYAGIFRGTHMLVKISTTLSQLAQRTTPFTSVLVTAIITNMFACNQTLSISLTSELCGDFVKGKDTPSANKYKLAQFIENSCITIAPLIPWSIACIIPLEMLQVDFKPVLFAFFLYLLPLTQLIADGLQNLKKII